MSLAQHPAHHSEVQHCMQARFMERQQALLHGDLHTGSLMCTDDTTYVIDAEFAFCGPIAFDVGKMIANLLIAYFASWGLEAAEASRQQQRQWLLQACLQPNAGRSISPQQQTASILCCRMLHCLVCGPARSLKARRGLSLTDSMAGCLEKRQ